MVEDHEPGARGALVDGGDVIRHSCLSLGSGVLAQARALLADPMGGTLGLVRPPGLRDRALDLRAGPRLLDELALGDRPLDVLGLLQPCVQDVADEQVVEDDADEATARTITSGARLAPTAVFLRSISATTKISRNA